MVPDDPFVAVIVVELQYVPGVDTEVVAGTGKTVTVTDAFELHPLPEVDVNV
jgi:hypothetical protein